MKKLEQSPSKEYESNLPINTGQNFYKQENYRELIKIANICQNMKRYSESIKYYNQVLQNDYTLLEGDKREIFGIFKNIIEDKQQTILKLFDIQQTKNKKQQSSKQYQNKMLQNQRSLLINEINQQIDKALTFLKKLQQKQEPFVLKIQQFALSYKIKGDFCYFRALYGHICNYKFLKNNKKNGLNFIQIKEIQDQQEKKIIKQQLQQSLECYKLSLSKIKQSNQNNKKQRKTTIKLQLINNCINIQYCLGINTIQNIVKMGQQLLLQIKIEQLKQNKQDQDNLYTIQFFKQIQNNLRSLSNLIQLDKQIQQKMKQLQQIQAS